MVGKNFGGWDENFSLGLSTSCQALFTRISLVLNKKFSLSHLFPQNFVSYFSVTKRSHLIHQGCSIDQNNCLEVEGRNTLTHQDRGFGELWARIFPSFILIKYFLKCLARSKKQLWNGSDACILRNTHKKNIASKLTVQAHFSSFSGRILPVPKNSSITYSHDAGNKCWSL